MRDSGAPKGTHIISCYDRGGHLTQWKINDHFVSSSLSHPPRHVPTPYFIRNFSDCPRISMHETTIKFLFGGSSFGSVWGCNFFRILQRIIRPFIRVICRHYNLHSFGESGLLFGKFLLHELGTFLWWYLLDSISMWRDWKY